MSCGISLKVKKDWLSLYAVDNQVDDFTTYCKEAKRGNFRLHPKGFSGISNGCIVIEKLREFQHLRVLLKSTKPVAIARTNLLGYGKVVVK